MPQFGTYSPWQDAAQNAIRPAGNQLSQLALEIARSRYNRNNQAAKMGLELERLQQTQILNAAHEKLYDAQTTESGARTSNLGSASHLNDAKTAHQQAVDKAAQDFGDAQWRIQMDKGLESPQDAEKIISLAHLNDAMGRAAALSGNPQRAFPVHNISANQVTMDPTTGAQVGQGPIVLSPGQSYQQPGQEATVNPRPYFAPAGATPMSATGQPEGPQTGFRPVSPGSQSSAVDATLARGVVSGEIDPSSPLYDAAMRAATNRQGRAVSPAPLGAPAGPPPAPASHSPDEAALMQEANDAISKGADPEAVKSRLKQMGYNPQ